MRLVPIDTTPFEITSEPITDNEGEASFRAAVRLFQKWDLNDEESATLLDMSTRSYRRWKADGPGKLSRDTKARLSNLMGIHKALRIVFGDSPRVYSWVRAVNSRFDGQTALDVMLGGELTDVMRVRRYLDAERGGW